MIVYRNPVERWFWESGAADFLFVALVVLLVFGVVLWLMAWFEDRKK